MDISIKITEATVATQNVHKNVGISTEATKATEAPQNVHKNVDISIKATEACKAPPKRLYKCGHFHQGY